MTPASGGDGAVPARRSAAQAFWRLMGFARPYVALLAAATLCAGLYAGSRSLRAYLVKPLLDDVMLAQPAAAPAGPQAQRDWIGSLLGRALPDAPTAAPASPPDTGKPLAESVRQSLWKVILAGLLIMLVIPPSHFGQVYLVEYGLGRVLMDIQQVLCAKLLALPLSFHLGMTRGERLSRVMNDASRAHRALDLLFGDFVQELLAMLIGVVILFSICWQLTLLTLLVAPLVAGVVAVFGRRIRRSALQRQQTQGDLTQRLVEILSGIKVIKAFRAEAVEQQGFQLQNRRFFRRSMRVVKNRAVARTVVEALNNAIGIAVLVGGAVLALQGLWGLTPGSLAAFAAVMVTTYRPLRDLAKGWTQLMDAIPSAERFFDLLDGAGEPPDPPDALRVDGVQQGIRIRNLSFSYGREPVLRNVCLEVTAGQVVAIVGRTGAGKTTLADLLLRFHDPDEGSIEIDGVDLRRIARDSWIDQIAVVTQEPFLFEGTIRDNIRYGRPGASAAEVTAAGRAAHVDEFAASLPAGYDTEVGEAGMQLSGGQRQRVTIARAILKNPAVLIFDEATSALDAQSERYVQDAIAALLTGRTTFVIAHRLATIRRADRIVVLDEGSVAAVGNHQQLMERGGLYQELVALQSVEP